MNPDFLPITNLPRLAAFVVRGIATFSIIPIMSTMVREALVKDDISRARKIIFISLLTSWLSNAVIFIYQGFRLLSFEFSQAVADSILILSAISLFITTFAIVLMYSNNYKNKGGK